MALPPIIQTGSKGGSIKEKNLESEIETHKYPRRNRMLQRRRVGSRSKRRISSPRLKLVKEHGERQSECYRSKRRISSPRLKRKIAPRLDLNFAIKEKNLESEIELEYLDVAANLPRSKRRISSPRLKRVLL